MTTVDDLRRRLDAVERAVSDEGTADQTALADTAEEATEAIAERRRVSARLDDLDERVAELESATQAIRGYVGSIRSVNERVERRADRALAAVERRRGAPPASPDDAAAGANVPSAAAVERARDDPPVLEFDASRDADACGDAEEAAGAEADDDGGSGAPLVARLRDAL
nr:hypothetical protein [Halobaculum gomorrense]